MIQKIVNNVFLRNVAALLIFRSPDILQHIAARGKADLHEIWAIMWGWIAFFIYFIFHNRVLYEQFLRNKKYVPYALILLPTIFVWREGTSYLFWLSEPHPPGTHYQVRELKEHNAVYWAFIYWADIVYIYIALCVYLAFKHFTERARLLQTENIQKDMELKQLNAQLNPHFLFNALNNIYRYQLLNTDSKELILKLSELMRYILGSSKKRTVSLDEEIEFIENYIAFERERLGSRCTISYHSKVKESRLQVVPLILFNFIENAFKHGTNSMQTTTLFIDISADEKGVKMMVENDARPGRAAGQGVGMENTRKRLDLLYQNAYQLDIREANEKYRVSLKLPNIYETELHYS